jgi:hypothetical protein
MDTGRHVLHGWAGWQPLSQPLPRISSHHVSQIERELAEMNQQLYEIARWEAGRDDFDSLRLCEIVGPHPGVGNRVALRRALRETARMLNYSARIVAALPDDQMVPYFGVVSCPSGSLPRAVETFWLVAGVPDADKAPFWQPLFDRYAELTGGATWFLGVTGTLEKHRQGVYRHAERLWAP